MAELITVCADNVGVGFVESITNDIEVDPLIFPAASAWLTATDHVPSTKAERSQVPPVVEPVKVQVLLLCPDCDAVTVTVPPFSEALTLIVGVVSLVMPSLELEPESEAADTATAVGALGAVVSITIFWLLLKEFAASGVGKVNTAVFPATSVIIPLFSDRAAVDVYSRSVEVSPACTV